MTRANTGNSSLARRRRRVSPMGEYDRLPKPLRRWLATATLPWSPRSALRTWQTALGHTGGDEAAALGRLDAIEARQISRDARKVWNRGHPASESPRPSSRADPRRPTPGLGTRASAVQQATVR
ncbi:DUF6525 family protein [Roseicyclus sp. F158]|uniref:DUF6525 family protein n=1 Tax=Tropicimonas omnivorans TaxID=3075590 RepID=A0ABU3DH41_9RHOB|nr:DUF6525 family protein [Roseicyclus sp. F158]MDT0683016.1 DUF6525 family protein [Roseicyclus sp. F158]